MYSTIENSKFRAYKVFELEHIYERENYKKKLIIANENLFK